MAAATRSKKAERAQALQEDIMHLLKEVWVAIQKMLSIKYLKEKLEKAQTWLLT